MLKLSLVNVICIFFLIDLKYLTNNLFKFFQSRFSRYLCLTVICRDLTFFPQKKKKISNEKRAFILLTLMLLFRERWGEFIW